MGRRADPQRVASAGLTGTAARYAVGHAISAEEALVEIRAGLAQVPVHRRQAVLDGAAALYVRPGGPGDELWYPAALQLLVDAGADADRARAIRGAEPSVRGLAGLGEQGGGHS